MKNYIINKNRDKDGHNEIHAPNCHRMPEAQNQVHLGLHVNATYALSHAKQQGWTHADGCYHCSSEAHHG